MTTYFWNKKKTVSYFLSVLVFWIHCPSFNYYNLQSTFGNCLLILLKQTLTHAAVPLFMIISGFLYFRDYSNDKFVAKTKKRVRTLLIPYLLWNTLNMMIHISSRAFLFALSLEDKAVEINLKNVFLGIFHHQYNGPFWFVFALICFSFLSPIISILMQTKKSSFITIGIMLVLLCFNMGLPVSLFYSQSSIIYYLVGCYIGRYHLDWFSNKKSKSYSIVNIFLVLLCMVFFFCQNLYAFNINIALETILLVFFSLFLWFAFDAFLYEDFIPSSYTNHHFILFAAHSNIGAIIAKIMFFILPKTELFGWVNFVVSTALMLIVIELLCYIMNKISPRAFKLLSGNR